MKKLISVLLLLTCTRLLAVTPAPFKEGVSFSFRISGVGNGTLTIYEESGSPSCTATTYNATTESNVQTAWLRPGKQYPVHFGASGPGNYWLSFIAPTGYAIYIDGISTDLITQSPGGGEYGHDYTIEIRPVANNTRGDAGSFSGIDFGKSVTWSVGLGGVRTGSTAGRICFKEYDLTTSPASRERLFYSAPNNYGQITVVKDGASGQTLRQVSVPQTVVDLVDDAGGGYWLKFYTQAQATWSSTIYTFSGSPWKTIRVESPDDYQLKITETEGSVSRVSLATAGDYTTNDTWTLKEGSGTTYLRTTTNVSSVPASNERDVVASVFTGDTTSSTYLVSLTKYHYVMKAWGEELDKIFSYPTSSTSDADALKTTYDYYTTSTDYGNYRRVKSVTEPTGNWVAYIYHDSWDYRGQVLYELHPYKDSPSTVTMNTAVCRVFAYGYAADWTGRYRISSARIEYNGSATTGQRFITPTLNQTTLGQYYTIYQTDDHANSSTSQRTISEIMDVRTGNNPDYNGLVWSVKHPDLTQESYTHCTGSYNYSTKAFVYGADISHFRTIVWHGSTSSSGATGFNGYEGIPFTLVYLIPYKSTMDVTIRNSAGDIIRAETHVYTGGSNFSPLTTEDFTYDSAGRLTSRAASNGATTSYAYTNGRLSSTTDPTGTETQFTYDLLGRVETTIKKEASAGTYADQVDITTTNTYDGANHVTQSEVTATSMPAQTTTAQYDLSGRLKQQVANATASDTTKRFTSGYDYTLSPRKVKITFPGGAYKTTEVYYDGQIKAVTGTAVVEQYFNYTVNTTPGTITTQVMSGTSTSSNAVNTTTDWLGRPITEVKPSPAGSGDVTHTWYYNSSAQLYKFSQPGLADTLYTYDTLGVLNLEGLDVSDSAGTGSPNGSLDLGGKDRITKHDWEYFTSASGVWWQRKKTSTYATNGSSIATQVGKTETQLRGFTAAGSGYSRVSRTDSYDIFGNVVTTYTEVKSADKLAVTTTVAPNSSTNAVQITYNGLLVSARDITNRTMTYGYDNLGRQTTSVDPRTGTTTTAYVSGTSLVNTITDSASVVQLTYDYDNAGRVKSTATPNPHYGVGGDTRTQLFTFYSYRDRNEQYRIWGDTDVPVEYGYDYWGRRTTMKTYRAGTGWTQSDWPGTGSNTGNSPGTADVTTWNFHEPTGLLSSKVSAYGTADAKTVSYTYTQAGLIDVRTWARGVTTDYGYSSTTGELLTVDYSGTTPDLTYTYNRLGKVATVVDATGTRTLNYNLGGALQQLSEDLPSYFGANTRITYGYDTATGVIGRPNALKLGTAFNATAYQSITYGYESTSGRFNAFTGGSQAFDYTYTANSNLLAGIAQTSSGWTQTRTYLTNRDLLDVIETKISTTSKAKFDYAYDNLGRRTSVAKTSDNVSGMFNRYGDGSQGLDTVYGYDDRSQLTSEQTRLGGTSTVLTGRDDGYAFDNIGNRSSASGTTHNGNSANYTTNALNQYTQRTVPGVFDVSGAAAAAATVTVDGSSSGVTHGGTYGDYFFKGHGMANNPNPVYSILEVSDGGTPVDLPAFTAGTPEAFTHDADGNLTSDGRWDYTYDAENRLVSMQTHTALSPSILPDADARRIEFKNDYLGRRVQKTVRNGYNGSIFTTVFSDEKFVYDGWNAIAKLNAASSNALMASYYWGLDWSGTLQGAGGVGGLLMVQEGGNSYLPMFDGNGNVMGLLKASDGTIAAAYEYDAFGQTLRESGTYAASNPFRFSTKYTDIETGLVYYGLRYYSPTLGRFINKDPIEEQGGLNLYGFCHNNAINKWDYLGMDVPDWFDGSEADYNLWKNYGPSHGGSDTDGSMNDVMMEAFSGDLAGNMGARYYGRSDSGSSFSDIYTTRVGSVTLNDGTTVRLPAGSTMQDFEPGGNFSNGLNLTENNSGGYTASAAKDPTDVLGTFLVHTDANGRTSITPDTATTGRNFVNGVTGSTQEHALLGRKQFGEGDFTLVNIPSMGLLPDLIRVLGDKLGFSSAGAKFTAGLMVDAHNNNSPTDWIGHSGGAAVLAQAMVYARDTLGATNLSGNTVTFNSGANNAWVTNAIADSVDVTVTGYNYGPWDAVPNVAGFNGNLVTMVGSTIASPLLFTPLSKHSEPRAWTHHPGNRLKSRGRVR